MTKMQELIKASRNILSKRNEIIAAYLYGSFLKSDSYNDIDIGLLLDENFKPPALYEARIAGEFEREFKRQNFDVRILNRRPVRFLFSILRNSKLIYCRDERKRIEFESRVMREYLDIKPHHELYERMRRVRYGRK